jgi:hypothetical protein
VVMPERLSTTKGSGGVLVDPENVNDRAGLTIGPGRLARGAFGPTEPLQQPLYRSREEQHVTQFRTFGRMRDDWRCSEGSHSFPVGARRVYFQAFNRSVKWLRH